MAKITESTLPRIERTTETPHVEAIIIRLDEVVNGSGLKCFKDRAFAEALLYLVEGERDRGKLPADKPIP